jgi:hypothetical protein
MQQLLEQWQESLGLVGLSAALIGAGFALGLIAGLLSRRRAAPVDFPDHDSPSQEFSQDTPSVEAPAGTAAGAKESARDKRRNPRRPGRSIEVFVTVPGSNHKPCKGVVLNRSAGGLGILVGDAYPIGSVIGVLPVEASHLTPWVETEVKTCRKTGDDWELGLQFVKVPPYSTMLLFG